jgi:hypothetical protein
MFMLGGDLFDLFDSGMLFLLQALLQCELPRAGAASSMPEQLSAMV